MPKTISVCIISAFIGTYSHVLLGSMMHGDLKPLYPLDGNYMYLIISIENLYKLCICSGLIGAISHFVMRILIVNMQLKDN